MEKGIFKLIMLTSVVMPAIMICVFPVAFTALRKSSLSHAFTSPFRLMCGAFGCIAVISLGSGPLGPIQSRISTKSMKNGRWPPQPVSALVVKMVGKLKTLPMAAWAMMLFLNKSGWMSCVIWNNPT